MGCMADAKGICEGGMNMDELTEKLNWLKAAVAGALAFAGAAWKLQIVLGVVLVMLMAIDYATGTRAAKRAGTWSSKAAREGFDHKIGAVVVVIVATMADIVFLVSVEMMPWDALEWPCLWMPLAEIWYCLTEAGSILENCAKMGAWVPVWFRKAISAGIAAVDAEGEKIVAQVGEEKKEGVDNC